MELKLHPFIHFRIKQDSFEKVYKILVCSLYCSHELTLYYNAGKEFKRFPLSLSVDVYESFNETKKVLKTLEEDGLIEDYSIQKRTRGRDGVCVC